MAGWGYSGRFVGDLLIGEWLIWVWAGGRMGRMTKNEPNYSLSPAENERRLEAPVLAYLPRDPVRYRPKIGVVGLGGIAATHLTAYRKAGYDVAALCSRSEETARRRREEFFPEAAIYTDYGALLARDDIEVIDLTPHPRERAPLIERALEAGKHVLSQKPFVVDLEIGERLCDLAEKRGVKLAVNQNGRWAPHFSYLREAVRGGILGQPLTVRTSVQWDHNWIKDLPFNEIHHILLYDFAVHWFDFVASVMPGRAARRVYATVTRSATQLARPPLLAQAVVEFDDAQAALVFDADTRWGPEDRTTIVATGGTARSAGPSLSDQTVTFFTSEGWFSPALEGTWFPDGFHGTMGELLCAIEEGREPQNGARENLRSLALCFAAIRSADTHLPVAPGTVVRL